MSKTDFFAGAENTEINHATFNSAETIIHYSSSVDPIQKLREVAEWISPINFRNVQNDTLAKHTPGTGEWVLRSEEFEKWMAKDQGVVLVTGMPGVGKTILASVIIDYLGSCSESNHSRTAVLFAYFRYTDSFSSRDILASLVKQLVELCPTLPSFVTEAYDEQRKKGTRPSENELTSLFRHLLQLFSKVYVILDALDEASDVCRTNTIISLGSLPVGLLMTSRPLDIASLLPQDAVTIAITTQTEQDIETFAVKGIEKSPRLRRLLLNDDALHATVIAKLKEKSNGMFLAIQLHLEELSKCTSKNALRKAANSLPSRLNDMYEITLSRIQSQSEEEASVAIRALVWLTYSHKALRITHLQHALAVSLDSQTFSEDDVTDIELIVAFTSGLIVIDEDSQVARLAHYTTHQFLHNLNFGVFARPHTFITASCIAYLVAFGFPDPLKITTSDDLDKYIRTGGFLAYAYMRWGHHARLCYDEGGLPQCVSAFIFSVTSYPVHLGDEIDYWLPCHTAAYYGLVDICQSIENVQSMLSFRRLTAFHLAAMGGHRAVVEFLLSQKDIDVNIKTAYGQTAIHMASVEGHKDVVELLLDHGAVDVDLKDDEGKNALHFAAHFGHTEVVRLLLCREGVDPDSKSNRGRTALQFASGCGHEDVVRLLLAHKGVDVNSRGALGFAALHIAANEDQAGSIRLLLSRKEIDVNLRNESGETALHVAASSWGDSKEVIRLLLTHKTIDVNSRNYDAATALHLASLYGHTEAVHLLLCHEMVDVNLMDNFGMTALHRASDRGHEQVVQLLLNHKEINVNMEDKRSRTALDIAIVHQHDVVAQLLVAHGCRATGQDALHTLGSTSQVLLGSTA